MKKNGLITQKKLAEQLGISKNQLSMMLSPNFSPIKSNALKLCEALDVNFEEIIEYEKREMPYINSPTFKGQLRNIISNQLNNEKIYSEAYKGKDFVEVRGVTANKDYSDIELFAGAGGLALGLEQAGFYSKGLVEIDKHSCQTLRKNRPTWNVINKDIIQVVEEGIRNYVNIPIGELDLLSGGYPCQAFSYAGKKMGLADTRGTMFYYYAKALKQLLPKMFLAENVRGMVNHEDGKTLALMLKVFSDIGYTVKWHVLRALDYDVAQKRERIVLVGVRNDLVKKHKLSYSFPKPFGYELTLRDVLKDVPKSEGAKYPEAKKKVLDLVPPGGYWRDLPDDIAKDFMGKSYYSGGGRTGMARRISWDEPCLTLTCSPAQKQTERCHPDETRPFTVREYARIQSFPDSWKFDCSASNAYKQIGNAVPVNMAKAIGLSIVNTLNQIK
ncbi:DNA (cytosine-5-)-methyltransferase [Herbivorax sp. ANBcel31]|uniref:DNA (cytosine-5-)-methyltransferase n=1 Tax=Herbivorax sp. ANBcel31 TaxID=3069754 RepID=UPI0027B44908|nr:DNA (cytosine-5-)-methyltransferase [Herbivorax sp. ANBcel31]MDQ2086455.1 DNA (cytosine-5-)-methyltransferase [Herbivorax sp. ANBcel31]